MTTDRLQILSRCRQRHEQREHGADDAKTGLEASGAVVRTDINETETAPCAEIAKVRAEMKADISSVRTDLETKIDGYEPRLPNPKPSPSQDRLDPG